MGIFVVGTWQTTLADKWQPYQFKGNERFEYKFTWGEDKEKREATWILDIKRSDKKAKEGGEVFEVTYIAKGILKKEKLGAEAASELWGVCGISLNVLILNPASGFFFGLFRISDLKVGERWGVFGAGILEVTGKEKVAGREGFVCQLFHQTEDGKQVIVAEWTVDPKLAMPLRSKVFEEKKVRSQIELIKYIQY